MLNLKTLLSKMLARQLKRYEKTYTVPALSAGASGYWNIAISLPASATIVSVEAFTPNISASRGLQVTPVNVNATNLFVNYYAPMAVTANVVNLTFSISYL